MSDRATAFHGCGTQYDPPFWSEELWRDHVQAMVDCGIRFCRLFEFSWSSFEPREGHYDFAWADRFIDLLADNDIAFILCTPGATPPQWLTHDHPETAVVNAAGERNRAEVRRHGCASSDVFMQRCLQLTARLAERYGQHDKLLGWQIDNELGHPACYCELCQERYRHFLRREFGSLAELNARCGLVVWSRDFTAWEQIRIPVAGNPQLHHQFRRFTSELWLEYVREHVEVMRPHTEAPITVNFMAPWHGFDHYEMARELDVVGMDYYPYHPADRAFNYDQTDIAFNLAYTRAIAGGEPYWLLETQIMGGGHVIPPANLIGEWTLRDIADGANLINYFRWDTPPWGGEEADIGLVGPGAYVPPEAANVKAVCKTVSELAAKLAETRCEPAPVGLLFTWPSWWKHLDHPPSRRVLEDQMHGYPMLVRRHAHGLTSNQMPYDLVGPDQDWDHLNLLVVAHCLVMDDALLDRLEDYVEGGGTLLLTTMSGIFDADAAARPAPYPASPLRELAGVATVCKGHIPPDAGPVPIPCGDETLYPEQWIDRLYIETDDVEVLLSYDHHYYTTVPALTERRTGAGRVLFLGPVLPPEDMPALYEYLLARLDLAPPLPLPDGLYTRDRVGPDGRRVRFVQNLRNVPMTLNLPGVGTVTIPARSTRVDELSD